jgi:hypothetical protein
MRLISKKGKNLTFLIITSKFGVIPLIIIELVAFLLNNLNMDELVIYSENENRVTFYVLSKRRINPKPPWPGIRYKYCIKKAGTENQYTGYII